VSRCDQPFPSSRSTRLRLLQCLALSVARLSAHQGAHIQRRPPPPGAGPAAGLFCPLLFGGPSRAVEGDTRFGRGPRWVSGARVVQGYDPAMPLIQAFISRADEGHHTEQLLDELHIRLANRAMVGRTMPHPEAIRILFFDEPKVENHHAAVISALSAIDRAAERPEGVWRAYLAVSG
jgi:hypothetical protein